jgi:hypothetical protein
VDSSEGARVEDVTLSKHSPLSWKPHPSKRKLEETIISNAAFAFSLVGMCNYIQLPACKGMVI